MRSGHGHTGAEVALHVARLALAIGVLGLLGATWAPRASADIYWTNYTGTIGKANLAGGEVTQNFIQTAYGPNGLAVNDQHIYWAQEAQPQTYSAFTQLGRVFVCGPTGTNPTGEIGRARLDGTEIDQAFVDPLFLDGCPNGVAVDDQYVYWADEYTQGRIGRVRLDGTDPNQRFISVEGSRGTTGNQFWTGVAVNSEHAYWTHNGGSNQSSPAAVLRATLEEHTYLGAPAPFIDLATAPLGDDAPNGVAVDTGHVYWANELQNSIGRANLDGSNPERQFISLPAGSHPAGVAVDGQYVYWASFGSGKIGRARLNGTEVEEDFIVGASQPTGVAVTPGSTDTTPPTVTVTGVTETEYLLGNVPAAGCESSDPGGSGIATPASVQVTPTGGGVGSFTATCSGAVDNAGNPQDGAVSIAYTVVYAVPGGVDSFFQGGPVNNAPTVNTGKAGRTYPVSFKLTDASGDPVTSLSAVDSIKSKATTCGEFTGDPADALEVEAIGGSGLRYDTTTEMFVFNWKTSSTRGCYTLFVTLDDGQVFNAYFQLK